MTTEVKAYPAYGQRQPVMMIHETEMANFEGRLAMKLLDHFAIIAAADDGEDSVQVPIEAMQAWRWSTTEIASSPPRLDRSSLHGLWTPNPAMRLSVDQSTGSWLGGRNPDELLCGCLEQYPKAGNRQRPPINEGRPNHRGEERTPLSARSLGDHRPRVWLPI
jgi:hypothetical protein